MGWVAYKGVLCDGDRFCSRRTYIVAFGWSSKSAVLGAKCWTCTNSSLLLYTTVIPESRVQRLHDAPHENWSLPIFPELVFPPCVSQFARTMALFLKRDGETS